MNKELNIVKSIEIHAPDTEIWDTLTNPEKIKLYLFGTKTTTDWKIGSEILFEGDYDGKHYKDKGKVIAHIKNRKLVYNYWSGFSGLEDIPENYSLITYQLELVSENIYNFSWKQEGFANKEAIAHSDNMLSGMLLQIKKIAENKQ